MLRRTARSTAALLLVAGLAHAQGPITTAFTYQGALRQGGAPANGLYDLRFRLYAAPTTGAQLGSTICVDNVQVTSGSFTTPLDFGNQFTGQQLFLEIDVRQDTGLNCSNTTGFTTLSPRQPLTADPYAQWAKTATALSIPNSTTSAVTVTGTGNVGIGTASPNLKLTVAGDMEMGTGSGDYHHFRIGGGNSDGFIYGSFPAFGDGIHMGYNFYANAAGTPVLVHSDGGSSRITTGYGSVLLATGNVGQTPINRVYVDPTGTTYFLRTNGNAAGAIFADPSPGSSTYPLGTPAQSAGALYLYSSTGSTRCGVRSRYNSVSVFPNQAELFMDDATATNRVSLYLAGEGGSQGSSGNLYLTNLLCTGSKSFITPYPNHPDQDLIYYCLEGPENGIYLRGTGHLIAGRAHIDLPETFSSIASVEGLTVTLTPLSLDSLGLACANRSIQGFDVGELMRGTGSYEFDWEIKAVRRGLRDKPIVANWSDNAHGDKPIPVLWQQRLQDIQRREADYTAEDRQLGPRR